MCPVKEERVVVVCDVAIMRVRADLDAPCEAGVQDTAVPGHGPLVTADPTVDAARCSATVQAAIAAAQRPAGDAS